MIESVLGNVRNYVYGKYRNHPKRDDILSQAYLYAVEAYRRKEGELEGNQILAYVITCTTKKLGRWIQEDNVLNVPYYVEQAPTFSLVEDVVCNYSEISYEMLEYIEDCLDNRNEFRYIQFFLEGFTFEEIATLVGTNRVTAFRRVTKILKKVKENYERNIRNRNGTNNLGSGESLERVRYFAGRREEGN